MARMKMSAELKAMLDASAKKRKSTKPIVRNYWLNKPVYSAKDLFGPQEIRDSAVPADSCSDHGLRPTWHGRAS